MEYAPSVSLTHVRILNRSPGVGDPDRIEPATLCLEGCPNVAKTFYRFANCRRVWVRAPAKKRSSAHEFVQRPAGQGGNKNPGKDPRRRGYAKDRLTFDRPGNDYVMVERDLLFNGTLTPKEITCLLYLRARGDRLPEFRQIEDRLQATRPTVNRILKVVGERGLVKNYGTGQTPRWGLVSLKNPGLLRNLWAIS
jgi:hypothetical protein